MSSLFSYARSPSIYASFLVIANSCVYCKGVEALTPFIYPLIATAVWLVFAAVLVGAICKALWVKGKRPLDRFRFVLLNIAAAIIAVFFPFDLVGSWVDFNLTRSQRLAVIDLIKRGKLERPDGYNSRTYKLPTSLAYLSQGGKVNCDAGRKGENNPQSLQVFFFTYRGLLNQYSGFEYSADGKPWDEGGSLRTLIPLDKNWYWVAYEND